MLVRYICSLYCGNACSWENLSQLFNRIQFLSVTYETAPTATEFLTSQSFPFLHIPLPQALNDRIGDRGYPVNVFLDRHRIVRRIVNGITTEWAFEKDIKAGVGEKVSGYLRTFL